MAPISWSKIKNSSRPQAPWQSVQRMKKLLLLVLVSVFLGVSAIRAQTPIDLGIQNIPQQTPVWCWAAVAQQIILASRGPNGTPPQCGLVGIASNVSPQACCQAPGLCLRTGGLQEIQALILYFGGHVSSIAPPANPMAVYQTLAAHHPIIMAVQSSPFSAHVVVIRGMAWTPQPVLLVNDPMGFFSQPVPFVNILPYWRAAIVVN
jgi:hypothetical protein